LVDAARVAERTGLPVITDFRSRDVAAGGEGAPLVPLADAMLFGAATGARALQNIGGIANVTVVPRRGSTDGVRAFDTGPGVAMIDTVVQALTGERFDRDGMYAGMGTPIATVVEAHLAHEFFHRAPPKSTGRELFGTDAALALITACHSAHADCGDADIVATATEITARSIADAYARFVPEPLLDVVLSGGGAHNATLVARLTDLLSPTPVRTFDALFFPGDAKEAVAFAYLGWCHLRGVPGNVPSSTGARGPRILGALYPA
jgi:anhydro-N-acetylmuramic acid kinase